VSPPAAPSRLDAATVQLGGNGVVARDPGRLYLADKLLPMLKRNCGERAGLESPDDILRLAAGLSPEQFKTWIAELADRGV
jgi:hypothetical protein